MKKIIILGVILIILIGASIAVLFFGPVSQQGTSHTANTATTTMDIGQTNDPLQQKAIEKYIEITDPAGFVNTDDQPIKIADYIGKKVIMVDFLTYSCINCQRTFPYLTAWYNKYKDDGLIIIGIHTPEFAFEKDKQNVIDAMQKFGITFPIVLDNNYGTWNAYGNEYWPEKYIIDIHGNVVYQHIGEGGYAETENEIQYLLKERDQVLGEKEMPATTSLAVSAIKEEPVSIGSPETYFGSDRNEFLANGESGLSNEQTLTLPLSPALNKLYLGGTWSFVPEYAISEKDASIEYSYDAQHVYIVAESPDGADVQVMQDGKVINQAVAGEDVDASGVMHIKGSRLYTVVNNQEEGKHVLQLKVMSGTLHAYTFTFG